MDKDEISAEEARQGEKSGRMRIVLAVSLAGAVIALGAVFVVAG